ncbi:MAG: DUF1559 domain-containing protein [bacterium]|nr:DUF1559 domain-containing protein [bacterium]
MLAAILLPILDRARQQAMTATCQANLKQIGLAIFMYANDYDGNAPHFHINSDPGNYHSREWEAELAPYLGYLGSRSVFYMDEDNDGVPNFNDPDSTYFAPKLIKVLQCPKTHPRTGKSYAYNEHLGGIAPGIMWSWVDLSGQGKPGIFKRMKDAGRIIAVTQTPYNSIGTWSNLSNFYVNDPAGFGASYCHPTDGGLNFLFADGHVEWIDWVKYNYGNTAGWTHGPIYTQSGVIKFHD